ncbi:hypothetical protein V6N11_051595 [Hibiscus sabdariffa]|uniref:Uncharacterized protein n=1 Tax=Hibiscus sabdariffa TaxID=183260 RepID=A0ABR2U7H0_9ROSI
MIECNNSIRSLVTVSMCVVGINIAFKKWFQLLAWGFNANLFTVILFLNEINHLVLGSQRLPKNIKERAGFGGEMCVELLNDGGVDILRVEGKALPFVLLGNGDHIF